MKFILYLLMVSLFVSCDNEVEDDRETETEEEKVLTLDTFDVAEFPSAVDGCACYFKQKGFDGTYVYVDDYAQTAFIKIGGAFEQLEIYDAKEEEGKLYHKCRSEHYGVELDLKQISQMDETWQYEGEMTVNKIDGKKVKLTVIGECGC